MCKVKGFVIEYGGAIIAEVETSHRLLNEDDLEWMYGCLGRGNENSYGMRGMLLSTHGTPVEGKNIFVRRTYDPSNGYYYGDGWDYGTRETAENAIKLRL